MMTTLRLPVALSARLLRLGERCAVGGETVVLAGLALLLRRYTGRTRHLVRLSDRATVAVDTTEDAAVHRFLAAARGWSAPPQGTPPQSTALPDPPTAEPFAGEVPVRLSLDGPEWTISIGGCPAELVEPFAADLAAMLHALAADAGRSTVDLLPATEYERRVPDHPFRPHGGPVSYPPGPTISDTFAAQVAAHPDRPAVLADGGWLTYRRLGSAVAATARELGTALAAASGPVRVALLCRHGTPAITGLLGVLAAGHAYVPLEPSFPPQRLAQVLAGSAAGALLVDAAHEESAVALAALVGRPGLPIVHIGQPDDGASAEQVGTGLRGPARPDDPAYVLFTSGSTGTPKGVVQSHRNVLFGIANHVRNFAITPEDRISVLSSFGYDMAVTDLFGAILSGAAAVPVDVRTHGLGRLAHTLARQGVTIYHSTPTVYRYLVASLGESGRLPDVRAVLLGGEEVTRHDVALARRHFGPDAVVVNGYGTTEISFATQWHIPTQTPLDEAVVPIGWPLPGVEVALLDPAGRPTCLTGEICVRTPHVALGYLGQPELTAQRFVEHRGVRAYRTGDLARRLPDGRLVFLGRTDRLVKIRGHRVELGEIEALLAGQGGVARAAVIARPRPGGEGDGDREIIGYVVPAAEAALPDPAALRRVLAASLPDFMLPRAIVRVDALPIGTTGKLDVAALPAPDPAAPPAPGAGAAPEPTTRRVSGQAAERAADASTVDDAAADATEQIIAAAWCEVLGLAAVSRRATFVELGGHSLLLARVQQRLETTLGRRLPLALLWQYPTIAALAGHLRSADPQPAVDAAVARAASRMRRRDVARHATPAPAEEAR